MEYQDFLELVKRRRSIRRFKKDPVPEEYVEKVLEATRFAPSGANSQPWEFVVLTDKEIKDKIVGMVKEHHQCSRRAEITREEDLRHPSVNRPADDPGFKDAPVFIILCGDPRTREAYPLMAALSNGDSIFASSLASAFLYMHLAATTLGLGSQWVSATSHPFVQCLLKELLAIPQRFEIYDMMALGYPGHQPGPRLVRERDEMVHNERFRHGKYRDDAGVKDFIVRLHKSRTR